jgi:hypothetical protein
MKVGHVFFFAALLAGAACAQDGGFNDDGGTDASAADGGSCQPCVSGADCSGSAQCVQLGVDSFCMDACNQGACTSGTCVNVTTFDGNATQACVPTDACGSQTSDAGSPPADSGVPYDGGGPVTGNVGPDGGTLSTLYFGVVGDTRPANYDDVAGYPTAIITKIFQDIQAFNPRPPFVLATGDYQFASSGSTSTASQQLALYLGARQNYSGVQFPAMGNHECTGSTSSNCGTGNTNGITANYTAFMNQLLSPINKAKPYYSFNVNATDNSWTSKFVIIAANAWDSTQSSWLSSVMAQKTTYTFVVRHEPPDASPAAPGQAPSEAIIAGFPYTLEIVGHSHTYGHYTTPYPREVIIGNGGAPLTNTSKDYGFGVFKQRSDGAIVCDMIDYSTLQADSYFHFVVTAAGALTK